MAAIAVTLTNVTIGASGVVYLKYSNGTEKETSIAAMEALADGLDANETLAEDILAAKLIRAQPVLDNPDALNGSTVSIDSAGSAPVIYTEA